MPSVDKGSKVLVSGANGYIGMWIVRTLLERGFAVRGSVRTEDKGKFVIQYFKSLGHGDKFEVALVDDIAMVGNWCFFNPYLWPDLEFEEGALDEAVKGVGAIVHTASPVEFNLKEPDGAQRFYYVSESFMYSTFYEVDVIKPAVQGTLGMLKSALKNGYVFTLIYMRIYIDSW
jgi:nucleoside-diphosphate-sugar epimerase